VVCEEQVEEEAQAEHVMKKLEMINDAPAGLLMLDHELGKENKHSRPINVMTKSPRINGGSLFFT